MQGQIVDPMGQLQGIGVLTRISTVTLISTAKGIAWHPRTNRIFACDYGAARVAIVNPLRDVKLADIVLTAGPTGITYCPTNDRMYVQANAVELKVIDPYERDVEASISYGFGGGQGDSGCFCPTSDRLYFADSVIDVVNPATNSVETSIGSPGFGAISGIIYCPSNGLIYAPRFNFGDVKVINPLTNTVVATITVGTNPYYLCYCPENDRIYVTNSGANTISVINPATNTVVATLSNAGSPTDFYAPYDIAYCPASRLIYQVNFGDQHVNAIRPSDNSVIASTNVGIAPWRLMWVPRVGKMYSSGNGFLTAFSV